MKYYCIHHDKALDRKEYILKNIANDYELEITWIASYDPESDIIKYYSDVPSEHAANKKVMNKAELSCHMKHQLAISLIYESDDYGFVFEDDIKKPSFDFLNTINIFQQKMIEERCDLLFVGSFGSYDLCFDVPTILCNERTKSRCAHAYIVNPKIAQKLSNYLKVITNTLDWQLNHAIDYLGLRCGWSYPHIYQRSEKKEIISLLR
jgi:GR25 family glycosyltransferase involved in LPS biosynthesis